MKTKPRIPFPRFPQKLFRMAAIVLLILLCAYFLLVYFLVSAALVPSFMERLEAFERITEESYAAQVQTSDIQANRQAALQETREWLEHARRQKHSIESADGYTLVAEEFPAEGTAEESHRWVLLLHGYTGWKEEMYPFAFWYHNQGFHVLAPDLRCQGESEGDFIGMGWTDHFDCIQWLQLILELDPDAEIILHGQSMGASAALILSGELSGNSENTALASHVRAIISDCAYTEAYAMFGEKIREWFNLPPFPLVDSACLVLRLRGGYDLKDASALAAVRQSQIPTLFIHGEADAMISVQMTEELYRAAACEKELLLVEDAGHAQSQDKDPHTYYGRIQKFLDRVLANN